MNSKIIIILIVLIAFIVAGASFFLDKNFKPSIWFYVPSRGINIQDKQITDNTKPFKIDITYPQINGLDDFNQKAKAIVDNEINNFKTNSLANDEAVKNTDPINYAQYPREYELDISYTKGQIDGNTISVMFNIYNFEGGAHGASYFIPLNYDVKNKKEIALANLFLNDANYLQKISSFCISDLTKQLNISGGIEMTNASWIDGGAGPIAENFQYFLINPDNTITFYFPQYQIAAYAAGDFKVIYPK